MTFVVDDVCHTVLEKQCLTGHSYLNDAHQLERYGIQFLTQCLDLTNFFVSTALLSTTTHHLSE